MPTRPRKKGGLSRYREMRDFSKTPEPTGAEKTSDPGALRFVIQKHAARRLHYDLRLELDGVFKSWAVTKGPSLDPHEKRLAVHVEDHPIEYGDFEGVIPEGEYGAGTVMIWDRGTWLPEGDVDRAYVKGHLTFLLNGEKLHGRWHLVRMRARPREKKEQWLFFKSEDEYAQPQEEGDILEEAPDSVASGRSLNAIATEEDAVWSSGNGLVKGALSPADEDDPKPKTRAQANPQPTMRSAKAHERSLEKIEGAVRAPFPGFVEPCLALVASQPPESQGWLHEIKFDGYRIMALIRDGRVKLMSRRGLDWTARFPTITRAFENFDATSAIVDGEAVVEDAQGITDFSALQDALSYGAAEMAICYAFDLLYLDGFDLRTLTLHRRKALLQERLPHGDAALRYSEHIVDEGKAMIEHACRLGLEGIICKKSDAPYRSGRRGDWLKVKCVNREEFVVGGYVPSTAMRGAIGSLVLGYYDAGQLIHVGRTGTGFSQVQAKALYERLQKLKQRASPFSKALSTDEGRGVIFVKPELVAEVEFPGWTADRHLRHAAFKGLREDKLAEEVGLDMPTFKEAGMEPEQPKRSTRRLSRKPANGEPTQQTASPRAGEIELAGMRLTHPDRILWEGQGVTKLGLAEYYLQVADKILPHIVGRPLALVRCPQGSGGDCFFQKRGFAGLSDGIETIEVPGASGSEETLVIRDLRGLISLVQASVLEIHPWGAPIDDPEKPDRLIFDLDPGDEVGWQSVITAAEEVRDRLAMHGLVSFVKTTGGKGLHIMCSLKPQIGWEMLKAFAARIAEEMEADSPSLYVSTMAKRARRGKIFIDYLRNLRGATAVAAYSTRARPGAPVSTPVRWDELGPELTASRYNVSNLPRRLSALKADPWREFFVGQTIQELKFP